MERRDFILGCRKKGVTWRAIGKLIGLSGQRAHQIGMDYKSPSNRPGANRVSFSISEILEINKTVIKIKDFDNITKITGIKNGSLSRTRELVRIRDGRMCQICKYEWILGTRRLDVHHLDEDRESTRDCQWDRENMDRMITLCHRCHLNLDSVRKKMGWDGTTKSLSSYVKPLTKSFSRSIKEFIAKKRAKLDKNAVNTLSTENPPTALVINPERMI